MTRINVAVAASLGIALFVFRRWRRGQSAPRPSTQDARGILAKYYGLQAATITITALPSYDDVNFRVQQQDGAMSVLKIYTLDSDQTAGVLAMQDAALDFLELRSVQHVPRMVPSSSSSSSSSSSKGRVVPAPGANKARVTSFTLPDGPWRGRAVRMVTYLQGDLLAKTPGGVAARSDALLTSVGRFLGEIDNTLAVFKHPSAARPSFKWNLDFAPAYIKKHRAVLTNDARRRVLRRHLSHHQSHVLPLLSRCRRGVIHGDANDYNVLVVGDAVAGLIDFGDMCEGYVINDLAICLAYMMLDAPHPLQTAATITAAFTSTMPLTEAELQVVVPLALLRLCVSVVSSAVEYAANPTNEYILVTERPAWDLLGRMHTEYPDLNKATTAFLAFLPSASEAS